MVSTRSNRATARTVRGKPVVETKARDTAGRFVPEGKKKKKMPKKNATKPKSKKTKLAAAAPAANPSPASPSASQSPQQSDAVKEILSNLNDFGAGTVAWLAKFSLDAYGELSENTKELWNSSTTTWPRVLDSAGCWNGKPPPTGDLILGALDTFARPQDEEEGVKWKAYFRGEESADVDPRRAVTQLLEPSKLPVSIIGLTLPATIGENYFRAAPELSEFVEVIDERHKQLLLTPKYSLTDLHIDSFDGMSVPLGACEKVWVVFPPTPTNVHLFKEAIGQKMILKRIGAKLEGGITLKTNSSEAIYLPNGCLHAVFTTTGGFLASFDFVTPTSAPTYAIQINQEFDLVDDRVEELWAAFSEAILHSLLNNKVAIGIRAWLDVEDRAKEYAGEVKEWGTEMKRIWEEFLATPFAKKMRCPCDGMAENEKFPAHWRKYHSISSAKANKPKAAPLAAGSKRKRGAADVEESGAAKRRRS